MGVAGTGGSPATAELAGAVPSLTAKDLVFVADKSNSALGDEIDMAGWKASNFVPEVQTKVYRTNYGDTSLPTNASSEYSRFMFSIDIERISQGSAGASGDTTSAAGMPDDSSSDWPPCRRSPGSHSKRKPSVVTALTTLRASREKQ